MENFRVAVNAVAPLACYILIGIFARRTNLADGDLLKKMNSFVFKVFFPILMFSNVYRTSFSLSQDGGLVLYCLGATILVILVLVWIVPRYFIKNDPATCGAVIQSSFRGNLVAMGVPLAMSVYGADNIGSMSIVYSFLVPLYNVCAVILLEHFDPQAGQKTSVSALLKKVLANPLIQGAIAGIIFNILTRQILHVDCPEFFQKTVSNISSATTVIALVILGGSLEFSSIGANKKYLVSGLSLKLFLIPLIAVLVGTMLGFRGIRLFTILVGFGTPVSVSSYAMSYAMHSNHELVAQYISISTVLGVFTLFLWINALLGIGLL